MGRDDLPQPTHHAMHRPKFAERYLLPMHKHSSRRTFMAVSCAALAWVGCRGAPDEAAAQTSARCAGCGMRVTRGEAFSSGATEANGHEVMFDAPKCMFRWLSQHTDARDAWCTEHLTRTQRLAAELTFVMGSDIDGPMGHDLVPVDTRAHAEALMRSHHGTQLLTFAEVTTPIVDQLFRM